MMNFKFSKERVINIKSDTEEEKEEDSESFDKTIKLTNESQYLSDNDEIELKTIKSSIDIDTPDLKHNISAINSLAGE